MCAEHVPSKPGTLYAAAHLRPGRPANPKTGQRRHDSKQPRTVRGERRRPPCEKPPNGCRLYRELERCRSAPNHARHTRPPARIDRPPSTVGADETGGVSHAPPSTPLLSVRVVPRSGPGPTLAPIALPETWGGYSAPLGAPPPTSPPAAKPASGPPVCGAACKRERDVWSNAAASRSIVVSGLAVETAKRLIALPTTAKRRIAEPQLPSAV